MQGYLYQRLVLWYSQRTDVGEDPSVSECELRLTRTAVVVVEIWGEVLPLGGIWWRSQWGEWHSVQWNIRIVLTISSRPETLWGLTKMMAQDGANCVRRSAPSFLQSPDPFCSPQRVIMMAQFPSHVGWKNKYCGPKTHHPMQF